MKFFNYGSLVKKDGLVSGWIYYKFYNFQIAVGQMENKNKNYYAKKASFYFSYDGGRGLSIQIQI